MENYLEHIEAYFSHKPSAEESTQFEQRIAADPEFAREVAFYLSARQAMNEELVVEKKEWFRQLLLQNNALPDPLEKGRVRKMWGYQISAVAAVVICLLIVGYLFLSRSTASPQQMADNYMKENFQKLGVTMSVTKDSLQEGLRLLNDGELKQALQQFEAIIQKDTANISALRYAGIVYLRLGNYDKALGYFQRLEKYSLYSNPATFYQALTIMKRNLPGDKQQARQLLQQVVEKELEGKETAQQWLKNW